MRRAPARGMEPDRVIRSRIIGKNVPRYERVASVLLGGVLAGVGLRRGGLSGLTLTVLAGGLVVRGVTGRCALYRMRALRREGIEVRRAVTIQCSPQEVYDLWRDVRNLPRFMAHVTAVEPESSTVSRWEIQEGPVRLAWRAEIVEDTPARRLRWRSLPGGDLEHEGTLDLVEAPGGRGTVVEVRLRYKPPGGVFVASVLQDLLRTLPGLQLAEELARLRMLIETGELATGARHPGEVAAHDQARYEPAMRADRSAPAGARP
jgi:uncharacterized membrane protein